MDAFIYRRPLVRRIPPPGFKSSDTGGAATMPHTNSNPFGFDLGIASPYSTASSWFSGGNGSTGRTQPFSFGLGLPRRAPISLSDLCDDYFPRRPANQFGPFPAMNPHNYYVPAGGFNPTTTQPVYNCGNPFDADGAASLAMEVPAPWDRYYDHFYGDGGHVVQPAGVEEPVSSVSSAAPAARDGGTLYDGYDEDIEATLRAQEGECRPSPDYLETTQRGRMSQETRATLVGWMRRLTKGYGLAAGTLHHAVSYFDRFLTVRPLELEDAGAGMTTMHRRLRLLGAAAVYAAAKYEDQGTVNKINAAEIASYIHLYGDNDGDGGGGGGFDSSKEEVLDMERALLAALDYRLGRPTAYTFVEHFTRHYDGREKKLRSCAHDFADMSLLHYGCLQHSPSAVAAAAMFLARLALKPSYGEMTRWNRELVELTGYEPVKLERCVETIHSVIPRRGDGSGSYGDVELFPMFYAIADTK